ncbi:PREDICTED: FACT complex subunit SSRP1-like [Branchiostoma belcheri]|uniref:FACT complex subunit SSRP1 n=1 Tax=Branchiostoma belcheri TaxID=7741 RepID=A0A6P4Y155_BRABE|nr:PREDICTED: FACT complex subunit SSRP1-like [Branchiostoma belcheri]
MSGDTLEFDQIFQENKGAMYDGRLRITKQGIVFKNNKTGKVDNLAGTDLNLTHWFRVARGYELKVGLKSGAVFKYDGFKESDFDKLSDFINKNYKMRLEEKELSVKGWNWGTAKFKGPLLSFDIDNMSAFEIPLGNVSHCATSKNEVALEFHQNDDADVSLMEMRFYVPPNQDNPDIDPVQAFHDNVMDKADIIQATGDAICIFKELQCLTPRGRYDVRIYPTFLHLHGKTFDYKLPYTTVLRLFLLPHKDQRQMFFVVSLDPPIKQGQTRYHFLILQFSKDEDMTLELSLSEEDCADKFEGKLQKEMSGPVYEIVSRVMKSMVNRKITVPGGFKGNSGTSAVSCSHKAGAGFLYPLERGFIYVHKPPIHLRFDEISCVNFARGVASNRTFDFEIETKSGTTYTFSSIEKEEYGKLFDFTTNKKLRVKNRGKNLKDSVNYDEDMMGSDDEGQHDAYMERVKAEAAEGISDEDESSDDEEEDADFNPDGSGSDIAEEYDSNASISSSDDDEEDEEKKERRKKKLEKAKNKPAKRRKASDGGRKRKKRQKKDPNAPKKAMTAFMIWLNATRSDLRKENPDASIGEIGKIAGEKWREMGPSDKEEWEQKAKEDKERYKAAMEEYEARKAEEGSSGGEESDQSEKKKSKKSRSSRPKPSPTKSPSKAGSGANYKSKEYISSDSDSDSSNSDSDSEEKEKKSKKKGKKAKKKSEDEEEEPIASTPPESEESASGGEEEDEDDD